MINSITVEMWCLGVVLPFRSTAVAQIGILWLAESPTAGGLLPRARVTYWRFEIAPGRPRRPAHHAHSTTAGGTIGRHFAGTASSYI